MKNLLEYTNREFTVGYLEPGSSAPLASWSLWCTDDGKNKYCDEFNIDFYSQAAQDYFALTCSQFKREGYFLEIGSNDPVFINNTFILENEHDWVGVMVEYQQHFKEAYDLLRPNSTHVFGDARKIDYKEVLGSIDFPRALDFLQIDLDWESSLEVLQILEKYLFNNYCFAAICYEHDFYNRDVRREHRDLSREIFARHGYYLVFPDVSDHTGRIPYEDWYVHPELVDKKLINALEVDCALSWKEIVAKLKKYNQSK